MATTATELSKKVNKDMGYYYNAKGKRVYVKVPSDYITNTTKELRKGKAMVPRTKYDAGITEAMDKAMKYNLNMNRGSGNGSRNKTHYFDRLYSVYPGDEIESFCPYVFIVRPDLNILDTHGENLVSITKKQKNTGYYPNVSPKKDQFFRYMKTCHPHMLQSLSGNEMKGHDFIPFLVGRTESLQIPDYQLKDYSLSQPYTNFNMPYASNALASKTGGQIEITFREDNRLRVHKLFQTWAYYIDGVTRNVYGPRMKYIKNNKFDYMCSIYYILCGPDAETILFWTKFTGAFPLSVPNSNLSFNLRGAPDNKCSITFAYFHQDPLDPNILADFNKNSHVIEQGTPYIPIYNTNTIKSTGMTAYSTAITNNGQKIGSLSKKLDKSLDNVIGSVKRDMNAPSVLGTGNGMVGAPFICKIKGNTHYTLRWKKVPISLGRF